MTAAVLSNADQSSYLLPYVMNTTPNPLKISTALEPRLGTLEIEVGKRLPNLLVSTLIAGDTGDGGGALSPNGSGQPIWCKKIEIRFSIGNRATDLTDSQTISDVSATISPNSPPDWRLQPTRVENGEVIIIFEGQPRGTPVQFTGKNSYVITINRIAINRTAGEAVIRIIEETSTNRDSGYQRREATRPAAKVTDEFYFYDLRPDKPAVNLTEFPILSWQGNRDNTSFTVIWHDGNQQRTSPANGISWSPPETPQDTTTYLVRAEHRPEGQTTPIYRYLAVTVIVISPNIVANNVIVKGNLEAGKQLTVGGEMRVNGMIEAPGGITGEKRTGGRRLVVHHGGLDIHTNLAVGTATTNNGTTTFRHDVEVTNNKKLTVSGEMRVNGMIEAPSGITGEKRTGGRRLVVHHGGLDIHTNLTVGTAGANSGTTTFQNNVNVSANLRVNNQVVLCNNSEFRLYNTVQREYLYAADFKPFDRDRRHVFTWRPGTPVSQGQWQVRNAITPRSLAAEGAEPEATPETPPED